MSLPKEFEGPANIGRRASRRALGYSKKQWRWAKKQAKKNNKVIKPYVDNMMGVMDDLTSNYREDRERYEDMFIPLAEEYGGQLDTYQGKVDQFSAEVDKLKQDAVDYGSQANKSFLMGRGIEDVTAQFEDAKQKSLRTLEGFGINPSATRYAALDYGVRMQEAVAKAAAGTQAGLNVDETSRAMFQDALTREYQARGLDKGVLDMRKGLMDFGEGVNKAAIAEAGAGAEIGGAGVNAKLAASELAGRQREGTANFLNSTSSLINSWTNTLSSGYEAALKEKALEAESSSGIGGAIGALAPVVGSLFGPAGTAAGGAASAFFAGGGEIPYGLSPSGGAIPDDVPVQASAGEYVIPEYAKEYWGKRQIDTWMKKAREGMGIPEDVA